VLLFVAQNYKMKIMVENTKLKKNNKIAIALLQLNDKAKMTHLDQSPTSFSSPCVQTSIHTRTQYLLTICSINMIGSMLNL